MSAARWALAVAVAWLMPWRAVRTISEQDKDLSALVFALASLAAVGAGPISRDRVVRRLADAIVSQGRMLREQAAPRPRRVQLVGRPDSVAPPYSGRHLKSMPRTRGSAG